MHRGSIVPSRAWDLLGWTGTDPHEGLRRSVAWHLAKPPPSALGSG
jgi:hypothetical protein